MKTPTPKEARESKKLTLDQVVSLSGISRSAICRSERLGRWSRIPSIAALHKKALGVA